jgi:hypothetical protein
MLTVLQFLSYNVLIGYGILGTFKFDPLMQALVYVPFYLLLVARWFYSRKSGQPQPFSAIHNSSTAPGG